MKKIGRKLFAMLLALSLLVGLVPMTAMAATTVDSGSFSGGLKWSINSDGVLTISGKGAMGNFDEDIPPWFYYYEDVTSIVINDGVTKIGNYAFALLYKASKVSIPSSVTAIGDFAFYYCESIANITFPNNLTSIGESAFQGCTSLETVNIPASLESIGFCAFMECYSLADFTVNPNNPNYAVGGKEVLLSKDRSVLMVAPATLEGEYTVPDTVKYIDSFAFTNSISVESINIHADVEAIGLAAFLGAVSLKAVNVSEANEVFSSDASGVLFDKAKSALVFAPSGMTGSYTIPDGVKTIYAFAFAICVNLTKVNIPDSVTTIDIAAFNSSGITEIKIPENVTIIGDGVFGDCGALDVVIFEGNAPSIGELAFENIIVSVYYPEGDESWKAIIEKDFGGDVSWIAYTPEEEVLLGDIDGDDEITNTDLIIIARYIVDAIDETSDEYAAVKQYGDMNADGEITNTDLITVARIIVGLE